MVSCHVTADWTQSRTEDLISIVRYISMVAAMCMVLYGYDASVYNSVQGSDNWLAYFDLDTVGDLVKQLMA